MSDLNGSVELQVLLERLAGQPTPIPADTFGSADVRFPAAGLGYSQLNELLLLYGFDRVTHSFFRFLLDGKTEYTEGQAFTSLPHLSAGVDRFRNLAVLLYGNVKFAFKSLSRDSELLESMLNSTLPLDESEFRLRHPPVLPIKRIAPEDAYLTGYLIERQLRDRLAGNPDDGEARKLEERRLEVVGAAQANQRAYLASDHLDVYVATSMRERHEFLGISRLVNQIFGHPELAALNPRYFDPTQAHCDHRIDKGLSEALMLRRAQCTIYLAQESDTLGKDSELASTLAQGKPVVAFVPEMTWHQASNYLQGLIDAHPERTESQILMGQLQIYEPGAAWEDAIVKSWCQTPDLIDRAQLRERLFAKMKSHYDARAKTLVDSHPLGIQVNLNTGVANGVLVVRTVDDCARLVRRILTQQLEFDLFETNSHIELREKISGSTFRVVTRDSMLTNAFWNFYLNPAE